MKKTIFIIAVSSFVIFFISDYCFAGLIDYKRRLQQKTGDAPTTAAQPALPAWYTSPPLTKNKIEQKYDTNRDGKLQTAETTIFLRDVLDIIAEKGGYTIDSDILKPYDKNKDGVISRKEATTLQEQVR